MKSTVCRDVTPYSLAARSSEAQFYTVVFRLEAIIPFYASWNLYRFFELFMLTRNFASVFGSTCTYMSSGFSCVKEKINWSSVEESLMCKYMLWCELAFQKWNQILILLRSKFSFVLVTAGIFEFFGPHSIWYLSIKPTCLDTSYRLQQKPNWSHSNENNCRMNGWKVI
jgi:hypothetical protein